MMNSIAARLVLGIALIIAAVMPGFGAQTQPEQKLSFEVAAIKPTSPDERARYIRMQGAHEFIAKSYTLKYLVSAAYNLTPKAISGGPDWTDIDRYDILAATPGETRPLSMNRWPWYAHCLSTGLTSSSTRNRGNFPCTC